MLQDNLMSKIKFMCYRFNLIIKKGKIQKKAKILFFEHTKLLIRLFRFKKKFYVVLGLPILTTTFLLWWSFFLLF